MTQEESVGEDSRVELLIQDTERQMVFLDDESRSLAYISALLQLEILKELRTQRQVWQGWFNRREGPRSKKVKEVREEVSL